MSGNHLALRSGAGPGPGPCLVADIGGTNARFALAQGRRLSRAAPRRVADFPSFEAAVRDYLDGVPAAERPRRAVFAVASPVGDDAIRFTNSRWSFSIAALRDALHFDGLDVVNDFAAIAWALPALQPEDCVALGSTSATRARPCGVRAVVGPGTGLGVAALYGEGRDLRVMPSEGGHVSFAPRDDDEAFVLRFLAARLGRVSIERLLSGEGLLNLYQARCARLGQPAFFASAEQITAAAASGDVDARATARSFCAVLGSFAGDVVLTFAAWDGIWLAGSMLTHVFDAEAEAEFRTRFEDKGRLSPLLRTVPTWRIVRDDVGTLGAAVVASLGETTTG